jgi:predicted lipid-binding transport protein (Tim44 family)
VGVIGVAVFREWTPPRPRPQPRAYDGATAPSQDALSSARRAEAAEEKASAGAPAASRAPGANMQEADRAASAPPVRQRDKLGTGHGERERSAVTFTDFRRAAASPSEVLTIHYDRYENLVARGIIPGTPRYAEPQPFPAVRFVPDPRS